MDTKKDEIVKQYNLLKAHLNFLAQGYSEQADEEISNRVREYCLIKSLAYKECLMYLDYFMGEVL